MRSSKLILKIFLALCVVVLLAGVVFLLLPAFSNRVIENTDSYTYDLPFQKGASYKVIQGYGGLFSHSHTAALDFGMLTGTPVCAAREGVVYSYKEDSDEGGPFEKYKSRANYIIVKHDDGSFGCYWHLQKNGVLVKQGKVAKGQQIGLSGSTGYTLWPHLHFSVKRKLDYDMDSYLQTNFNTTDGTIFLSAGKFYTRP